jgi:hypothetical protein
MRQLCETERRLVREQLVKRLFACAPVHLQSRLTPQLGKSIGIHAGWARVVGCHRELCDAPDAGFL